MAYLNCPFCPSQAIPASVQEPILHIGMGLVRLRCIAFKHESYVKTEDLKGKPKEDTE
jgi:hypothetical protein